MREKTVIHDLEHKQPYFRQYCEEKSLREGDEYYAGDFSIWATDLPIEKRKMILKKFGGDLEK